MFSKPQPHDLKGGELRREAVRGVGERPAGSPQKAAAINAHSIQFAACLPSLPHPLPSLPPATTNLLYSLLASVVRPPLPHFLASASQCVIFFFPYTVCWNILFVAGSDFMLIVLFVSCKNAAPYYCCI